MDYSLRGVLSLDSSSFTTGLSRSQASVSGITKSLGKAALGVGAFIGVSLGIKDTFDTFVSFEKEMSNVQAILGPDATQKDMKDLNEKAKEMGRILPASAQEAAEAMSNLASAGFNSKEVFDSVEGTLYLATAAQTDMGTAAEITSGTLHEFGLEANKANHVADVLAKTSADTNAGILDLGESLKYSGLVASSFGLSLEEVAAATGIMANANIKGSQSGTALRSILSSLASETGSAKKTLKDLKINAFASGGKLKKLSDIVQELNEKTSNLSDKDRASALTKIFGKESLTAVLALMDSGKEKIDSLTKSFVKSDGAAKAMAETQTDNVYGAMQSIEGALETMKIDIGEKFAPYLKTAFNAVADAIPVFSDAMISAVDKSIKATSKFYRSVKPTLKQFLNFMTTEIAPRLETVFEFLKPILESVFGYITNTLLPGIASTFQAYMPSILSIVDNLGTIFKFLWDYIVQPIVATLPSVFKMVSSQVSTVIKDILGLLKDFTGLFAAILTGDWQKVWTSLKDFAIGTVKLLVHSVGGLLKGMVTGMASTITNLASNVKDAVLGAKPVKNTGVSLKKTKKNANGTSYLTGGNGSIINERGGEFQMLPNGTTIVPADRSKEMAKNIASKNNNININIDARGMDVDTLVTQLKLRLNNI